MHIQKGFGCGRAKLGYLILSEVKGGGEMQSGHVEKCGSVCGLWKSLREDTL